METALNFDSRYRDETDRWDGQVGLRGGSLCRDRHETVSAHKI